MGFATGHRAFELPMVHGTERMERASCPVGAYSAGTILAPLALLGSRSR